ncbi:MULTISPECIES: hypothetical protein [Rhizobiaceae]|jgi:hypothetical protein|uniref:Lipoprotein n=1 Tax=Aliirhizobium cellulosilyticum TaxID=393664 RepID=A0A7W6SAY3_9HYPH|nr:hypothetical protein [Rhizobium cellulosilyticum]MBB4350455.1 hypothetical protein [Rhizobium cellulosilyticum]MBB4413513.1 hypothetical protein [Rhizobium cellulosilyticum]MBB4448146.1 hypothetical protein [Rhizobium cellulosilyticum]
MKGTALAAALAILALASCQRETEGKLVELSGRLFVFNYRVATANYLVTLKKLRPLPDGSVVTAEFENPKGGDALKARERIFPIEEKIVIQSPHLQCVRKDRSYAVTIRILSASGDVLQEIETSITSDVDQSVLPAKPLVVGPGYTPNPDVFHADGSEDMSSDGSCPR